MTKRKVKQRQELKGILERLKAESKAVVFTNGCFDILHVGHVQYLEEARALGDVLVVGVNSDASVRKLKGPERPLLSQEDRARMLAALEAVSFVTIFDEDTPSELLRALEPDIHVKGGDYAPDDLPEAAVVRNYGGRVEVLGFVEGRSTTDLLARIRSRFSRDP